MKKMLMLVFLPISTQIYSSKAPTCSDLISEINFYSKRVQDTIQETKIADDSVKKANEFAQAVRGRAHYYTEQLNNLKSAKANACK